MSQNTSQLILYAIGCYLVAKYLGSMEKSSIDQLNGFATYASLHNTGVDG